MLRTPHDVWISLRLWGSWHFFGVLQDIINIHKCGKSLHGILVNWEITEFDNDFPHWLL